MWPSAQWRWRLRVLIDVDVQLLTTVTTDEDDAGDDENVKTMFAEKQKTKVPKESNILEKETKLVNKEDHSKTVGKLFFSLYTRVRSCSLSLCLSVSYL